MQRKVVITGGPGTGKSTVIAALEKKGYFCLPEVSREITLEARKKGVEQLFLTDPLLFSKRLLEKRFEQYHIAGRSEEATVFFDRGVHDVVAYLEFQRKSYDEPFLSVIGQCVYDDVFVLPPWESIYHADNERYENFKQAKEIYKHLKDTYRKYNYRLVEVPLGDVADRVDFILDHLKVKM